MSSLSVQWAHKWQSQHALAQTSAYLKASRLAQARPPFPAVEPWVSSLTDLVLSVTWEESDTCFEVHSWRRQRRCRHTARRSWRAFTAGPYPLPAPAPPFPVPGLQPSGQAGLRLWNLLSLLRGLSPAEAGGFFSCQDERIVVTGSGTREGEEPLPLHRLS